MGNDSLLADILAYAGGVSLAICLIPQLHLIWKNRSAKDVSVSWTLFYIMGLSFTFAYLYLVGAFAGWLSIFPELCLTVFLLGSKIYLDRQPAKTYSEFVDTETKKGTGIDPQFKSQINQTSNDDVVPFVSVSYRGYHVFFDYNGIFGQNSAELTAWVMKTIEDILVANKVRFVHKHAVVFDGIDSPPGFTSVFLIDESHVSAHSYSELGMLALDVFTCGGRPDNTKKVADQIHAAVLKRFPECMSKVSHARRFPVVDVDTLKKSARSHTFHETFISEEEDV
jgi:S-adenosylmethionine/arginine decarboxylase-like enzyme